MSLPVSPAPCPASRQVTVSVVSHGQEALLRELLADIVRHASDTVCRIVLTHNLPTTDPALLAERALHLHNPTPKGFGANHNAAFQHCDTEWFAVVNPDIRFDHDVFLALLAHASPGDGVLAPALLDPRTGCIASNRGLLTPLEIVGRKVFGHKPPSRVVWLPGAFLLLRAETFRQIGGFDERFHLYAEDFDLCARLRLTGADLRYVADVRVTHAAQFSSHVRWRYLRWHVTSLLRLWLTSSFWKYRALLRQEQHSVKQSASS